MLQLTCPLCRLPLDRQPRTWRCAQGHSFDVAREGYVNLLPVQHKSSREPGDNPEMVTARREFLQAGHYQPLRDAAVALIAPLRAAALLDIGCGEGYYTAGLATAAADSAGLDIAKPAVRLAARRFPGITWLVGNAALLPLADASVDLVCSLFSQLQQAELRRVLAPGGRVLLVTPAPDHLWSLRQRLFDSVQPHQPDKFLGGFEGAFELQTRQEVRVPLSLSQEALRQLLQMTPYAWKAKPEKRAALENCGSFATAAAFSLMLLRSV